MVANGPARICAFSGSKKLCSSGTTTRRYSSSWNTSKILSSDVASKIAIPRKGVLDLARGDAAMTPSYLGSRWNCRQRGPERRGGL